MNRTYDVVAIQMTIWFNVEGDHDHNGLIYVLRRNLPLVKYLRELAKVTPDAAELDRLRGPAQAIADEFQVPFPTSGADAKKPHEFVRPLVLRAHLGDVVTVNLENEIPTRPIGMHLVGPGYDVKAHDGSQVGANPPSLAAPGGEYSYVWTAEHEGVFPFHDGGDYSGGEDGTNVHGLFGAFIVEPVGTIWRDPVSGVDSSGDGVQLDGLYLDIIPPAAQATAPIPAPATIANHQFPAPVEYTDFNRDAHREFVVFFHDEPEFVPPHGTHYPDPCHPDDPHGGHGGHGVAGPPIMPVSYRAEPMVNKEQILFRLMQEGHDFKGRPVLNEEQHHSSWMFGDPATPIFKAYIGDPVRIRFVHAAVKETHVFHLHLYEWHAVPEDRKSPRIDAISVSPQTGHTIEPVWGAGNRHQVAGDVIWHCHLYPHFHEGMWGIFRTFETLQEGTDGPALDNQDFPYAGRRIGRYPNDTRIERLLPLPGRVPPPLPTPTHPGYPLYIPGEMQQKSPIPPWPMSEPMPVEYDYREVPTGLERNAFNPQPVPGEIFTRRPFVIGQDQEWPQGQTMPADRPAYHLNGDRIIRHDLTVAMDRIDYNGHGWHDKHGHFYYLTAEGPPAAGATKEPLFFRARHGQILNLSLANQLPLDIPETEFDHAFPPCPARPWQGECTPHVHMVKFDPICADGASVGWNYISGPVAGKTMRYRWWLDQEFGTIFFHDHLFANFRQKHGLFGALIVEPAGARFLHNKHSNTEIVSGAQARIDVPGANPRSFREFCMGLQDFIPMWNSDGEALNPPHVPGGHGDQGIMAINYRNDPIHERLKDSGGNLVDPASWFSSGPPYNRDPYTARFDTRANDPIWFRMVQGSHEEQHSFQIHGMRWREFRSQPASAIRNQQSFGISEAFTFKQEEKYGRGDYLYKLSGADDLWLGCWGLVRAFGGSELEAPLPLTNPPAPAPADLSAPIPMTAVANAAVALQGDGSYLIEKTGGGETDIASAASNSGLTGEFALQLTNVAGNTAQVIAGLSGSPSTMEYYVRLTPTGRYAIHGPEHQGVPQGVLRPLSGHVWLVRDSEGTITGRVGETLATASIVYTSPRIETGTFFAKSSIQPMGGKIIMRFQPVREAAAPSGTREFHVTAERRSLVYREPDLIDPLGLVYRLTRIVGPDGLPVPVRQKTDPNEPLILRCREGETVKLVLTNGIPADANMRPEPFAPSVPVEEFDLTNRPVRPVSRQVSMHADLVRFDVRTSDGATVGLNPRQTAAPGETVTYSWQTARPAGSPEPIGPLLLQDMADFRNHRHHGLIGALIVEPADARALHVPDDENTAEDGAAEAWDGPRATIVATVDGQRRVSEEAVLLLQDGLRHFLRGNLNMPISDEPPSPGEDQVDHEDQGQKAFNYRSEPIERHLNNPNPATPIFNVPANANVRMHLIGAGDKPRQHSFTVHGVGWPDHEYLGDESPIVASESAISNGTARTYEFRTGASADYAYRSGVLKWAVPQGLWGLLRVGPAADDDGVTDGDKGDIVVSDGGQTWRLKTPVKLGEGEPVDPYVGSGVAPNSATEASLLRIREGTQAEPSTSLVPLAKVERVVLGTDPALQAAGGGAGADFQAADHMAASVSVCQAVDGSHAQAVGLLGSGINYGQTGSGLIPGTWVGAVGVHGVGYATGPETVSQGGFFHGTHTNATGYVASINALVSNESGSDYGYTPFGPSSCGIWINAAGTADLGAGIIVSNHYGRQFDYGIAFTGQAAGGKTGGIKTATLRDDSTSPTVFDINGSHTNGLDTTDATFSGRAILLGDSHSMGWKNQGFTLTGVNDVTLTGISEGLGQLSARMFTAAHSAAGGQFLARTPANPTSEGQSIGSHSFGGAPGVSAAVRAFSTEPWTPTARGTRIGLWTTPTGSTGWAERARVGEAGVDIVGGGNLLVSGTKVVGARGAAVADATDAASAVTQLNVLLERLRAHGLIAS